MMELEHGRQNPWYLGLYSPAILLYSPFLILTRVILMSQHRSLRSSSTIAAKRNVLKRFERVDLLKKRGQWKEGRSVMNLPKTKPDA
jgi:small basic protein (TIGR04137 family)